jgi:anti-sigma B factor antagonist
MGAETRTVGSVEIVSLDGRLDASAAPEVRRHLRSIVDVGKTRLLIDLGAVSFVDSSGLSVLVTALKLARGAGGDVAILKPTADVRALLELTRLHLVFQIFEDEGTAVAALAS